MADLVDPPGRPVSDDSMRAAQVVDGRAEASTSRVRATILPVPRNDDRQPGRQRDEGEDRKQDDPVHRVPGGLRSSLARPELRQERRTHLEQVADDEQVREVGDRRVRDRG